IIWDDFNLEDQSSHILKRSSDDDGNTFGQFIKLSSDSEFAINEIINVYNNNVYVVWQGNNQGQFDIFLSKSSDGGITFNQPINLSNDKGDSIKPNLIALQNNLFVIWNDNSTKNYNVIIKRSSDGGITFNQPINLSNTTDSINPQLATAANKLFVVWQEDISENNQIYFTTIDT
ncbi:MAG TPA: sialidase family protein, partial [Nitrososphaeraceae archaeon]|nr:sialidase family protein [Nitrososphaeraceae archaeon]